MSPRIVFASVLSYLIGELLNTTIIAYLKVQLLGQLFALRAIFSTLLGSFVESAAFGSIAFYGRIPTDELINMIIFLTVVKVIYEVLMMPFTIRIVRFLKRKEGLNVFEKPSLKGALPRFFY
ncbi:MAG: hypothetical protein Tsb006_7690 [Rickettsiaceae bacterium]